MIRYDLDESEMCQDETGEYVLYSDICHAQNEHNARLKELEIAKQELVKERESLRDKFAMAAINRYNGKSISSFLEMARDCYEIADAMLEARKS